LKKFQEKSVLIDSQFVFISKIEFSVICHQFQLIQIIEKSMKLDFPDIHIVLIIIESKRKEIIL
jgi:hypothetical protein